ncbi:MAG TPA: hypothetical protein V6C58_07150, partial [Allocoleopsis sp.]
ATTNTFQKLGLQLKDIPQGAPNLIDIPDSDINKIKELQFSLEALANVKERLRSNPLTSADVATLNDLGGGATDLEKLNQLAGESTKLNKSLELSDQLINSIANEFADLFTNLSKDGVKAFEDIAKSIAQTTQRILIQYAVTQALKALLNTISSGTGSAVDLAGLSKTTLRGRDLDILQLRGLIG